jgi:hypothetical protein
MPRLASDAPCACPNTFLEHSSSMFGGKQWRVVTPPGAHAGRLGLHPGARHGGHLGAGVCGGGGAEGAVDAGVSCRGARPTAACMLCCIPAGIISRIPAGCLSAAQGRCSRPSHTPPCTC